MLPGLPASPRKSVSEGALVCARVQHVGTNRMSCALRLVLEGKALMAAVTVPDLCGLWELLVQASDKS